MPLMIYRFSYDIKKCIIVTEKFNIAEMNDLYVRCFHTDVTGKDRYYTIYRRNIDTFDTSDRMWSLSNDHEKFIRSYFKHMRGKQENLLEQISDIDKILESINLKSA